MNKIILMFEINNNQELKRVDESKVSENSINFLFANFLFPSEWEGLTKKVLFKYGVDKPYEQILNKNDKCKVPEEVIKSSGFKVNIIGYDDNNTVIATTNDIFVNVSKNMSGETAVKPTIRTITSETLNVNFDGNDVNIEIPNIYGTKLVLDKPNGILKLLGRNENGQEVELANVDFPTEKIITNAYYDQTTQELVLEFENAQAVRVPIKTDFSNYYNKQEIDKKIADINIPTKVSQLENDKGYLTEVPSEYVTESELQQKGYITSEDIKDKVDSEDVYTKEETLVEIEKVKPNYSVLVGQETVEEKTTLYQLNADGTINKDKPINVGLSRDEVLELINSEFENGEEGAY